MEPNTLQQIFNHFELNPTDWHCVSFGTGLINSTWVLKDHSAAIRYILQKINHRVFKRPEDIDHNLRVIGAHLERFHPDYLFAGPYQPAGGNTLFKSGDGEYYRMFPFVSGSKSLDVVSKPGQAYEAARSFARFSMMLNGLNLSLLRETLPHFHDLGLRFRHFERAVKKADPELLGRASPEIAFLQRHGEYVRELERLKHSEDFPRRVIHHDTKISNILFDKADKALCVIDLDTVMPGYFVSDVGDMMRTYLPPVSEEEQDLSLVVARPEYFEAIVSGYLNGMEGQLTSLERRQFLFAGRFMIYMQALRFLSDFLEGNVYYGARYEGHNLLRAQNQICLLKSFNGQEEVFNEILSARVLNVR
jgi:aminoglycoside phosphotransferase (APT) family kinase protein